MHTPRNKTNTHSKQNPSQTSSDFYILHGEVKKLLKKGQMDAFLLTKVGQLEKVLAVHGSELRISDEIHYLKSLCMVSEAYDSLGLYKKSKEAVKQGAEMLSQLSRLERSSPASQKVNERELSRERIRFCLDYSQAWFYRDHKYAEAKQIVLKCHDLVLRCLSDPVALPCWGTLAQTMYYLGRVHRQMNEYSEAERCFAQAMDYYRLRGERKKEIYSEQVRASKKQGDVKTKVEWLRGELDFTSHRSAICLGLGLGWVNYTRGFLTRALYNNILPARVMLLHTGDELNRAYIELIYGSIIRSLAGSEDKERLAQAEKSVLDAYAMFKDVCKHRSYMARASWEMALICLQKGDLRLAEARLTEVEDLAKETNDVRWRCNSLIVRSRIERKRKHYSVAQALASQAFTLSDDNDQVLCKIDALIARGEAQLELKKPKEARADFEKALLLNTEPGLNRTIESTNPKIEAICNLNLSQSYLLDDEFQKANHHLERWKQLEKEVEHKTVHEVAASIEATLRTLSKDFFIEGGSDTNLEYQTHSKNLQKFLIGQAKQRTSEKQGIADLMRISRQTLYQWEKEISAGQSRNKPSLKEAHHPQRWSSRP